MREFVYLGLGFALSVLLAGSIVASFVSVKCTAYRTEACYTPVWRA